MDDMAREWVNARLEATEERMNGTMSKLEANQSSLLRMVSDMYTDVKDIKAKHTSVKTFIISSALTVGLAIGAMIIAALAFGVQILDLARSFFELGKAS